MRGGPSLKGKGGLVGFRKNLRFKGTLVVFEKTLKFLKKTKKHYYVKKKQI